MIAIVFLLLLLFLLLFIVVIIINVIPTTIKSIIRIIIINWYCYQHFFKTFTMSFLLLLFEWKSE
jgi:hypothetical protein